MTHQHHPDDLALTVKLICETQQSCCGCSKEKTPTYCKDMLQKAGFLLTIIAEAQERRGLVLVPIRPTAKMRAAGEQAGEGQI